jgi:hypothetical protein
MKDQYFGDVNDYRKYGLLRLLAKVGQVRIGVCWMLTPDDNSKDGGKTKLRYLKNKNVARWHQFDPPLYEAIRSLIWDTTADEVKSKARLVAHFDEKFVPKSVVWDACLEDCPVNRQDYFTKMFTEFRKMDVELIFFDPDNGLAGNVGHRSIRKGGTASCKHLFCDEVQTCFDHGFSALVYQHFRQKASHRDREALVRDVVKELQTISGSHRLACFCTPDVFYVLVPAKGHRGKLLRGTNAVATSPWNTLRGSTKSKTTNGYQITVSCYRKRVQGGP